MAKALIRLCVCAGWSESLLVAHTTLLELSCRGSFILYGWLLRKSTSVFGSVNVIMVPINEPQHESSDNVVCATNKDSDQRINRQNKDLYDKR